MSTIKKAAKRSKMMLKKTLGADISHEVFQSYHYQRHNARRLEHLATLGLDIAGSTVLELGAGIGDHTNFFLDRGCTVTTSDGREENLKILRERYPQAKVLMLDIDNHPPDPAEKFDLVYSYGLLYHLKDPDGALRFMSCACSGMLLLETCVSFGSEEAVNLCSEDVHNPTQSVTGTGCRPTRPWIFSRLKELFEFVYMPSTQPNHEEFPLDWTDPSSGGKLSRAVFIASRKRVDNPLLLEDIPMKQRRAP